MQEINKKQWYRFFKELSQERCFARCELVRVDPDGRETPVSSDLPLLGLTLLRKRGRISAFEVILGQVHNGNPTPSHHLLGAPSKVIFDRSDDGLLETVEAQNDDGNSMVVRIAVDSIDEAYESFVGEMAYSLAETRGFAPGRDREDWFLAERLVREAALNVD